MERAPAYCMVQGGHHVVDDWEPTRHQVSRLGPATLFVGGVVKSLGSKDPQGRTSPNVDL